MEKLAAKKSSKCEHMPVKKTDNNDDECIRMIMFLLMVDNHECSVSPDTRTSVVVVGFARECCGEIGHGQKPKS